MSAATVSTVTAAWLRRYRPADLPGEIRDMTCRDPREKPLVTVVVEPDRQPHPLLRAYQLTLRAEWVAAEDPGDGFRGAVSTLAATLAGNFGALAEALAPYGLTLRRLLPGADTDEPGGDIVRRAEWPFTLVIQLSAPGAAVGRGTIDGGDADDLGAAELDGGGA